MAYPKVSYSYVVDLNQIDSQDWEHFNKIRVKHVIKMQEKSVLVRFVKSPRSTILRYACSVGIDHEVIKEFVRSRIQQYRVSKLIRGHA